MANHKIIERDPLYVVEPLFINPKKKLIGKLLVWGCFSFMLGLILIQYLKINENITFGFETWRPILYSYMLWAFSIGYSSTLYYLGSYNEISTS